jgi:hypothetical protein
MSKEKAELEIELLRLKKASCEEAVNRYHKRFHPQGCGMKMPLFIPSSWIGSDERSCF